MRTRSRGRNPIPRGANSRPMPDSSPVFEAVRRPGFHRVASAQVACANWLRWIPQKNPACEDRDWLAVSFHQVVHSERIGKTGVTTLQDFRSTPNEHPHECPTDAGSSRGDGAFGHRRSSVRSPGCPKPRLPEAQAAREFGVCAKIVIRWTVRFRTEGRPGMQDRSSRPKVIPVQTAWAGGGAHHHASPPAACAVGILQI